MKGAGNSDSNCDTNQADFLLHTANFTTKSQTSGCNILREIVHRCAQLDVWNDPCDDFTSPRTFFSAFDVDLATTTL